MLTSLLCSLTLTTIMNLPPSITLHHSPSPSITLHHRSSPVLPISTPELQLVSTSSTDKDYIADWTNDDSKSLTVNTWRKGVCILSRLLWFCPQTGSDRCGWGLEERRGDWGGRQCGEGINLVKYSMPVGPFSYYFCLGRLLYLNMEKLFLIDIHEYSWMQFDWFRGIEFRNLVLGLLLVSLLAPRPPVDSERIVRNGNQW